MVRVRIAPSPTGDPHVGTAYIALFNQVLARSCGGQFILRIEDTDRSRSHPQWEGMIMEALKWLGLAWDEGPDIGGPHAPYRQSERGDIYRRHADILLEKEAAYRCFCTPERLDGLRKQQLKDKAALGYDGHCRSLTPAEIDDRLAKGIPHVVRLRVPKQATTTVKDELRGEVAFDNVQIDDQVLLKSDGMPTYHLANVVDDHLMQITHVMRAEEWLTSTPKHTLLYRAFAWPEPKWIHMPILRNPDKSKISKRRNPVSLNYYREAGFLPEVMVNYLGMMGWTMPDGSEKFGLEEMIKNFSLDRVSLGGPVFDVAKLTWLNGIYIREESPQRLVERLREEVLSNERLLAVAPLVRERIDTLESFVDYAAFFFSGDLSYDADTLALMVPKKRTVKEISVALSRALEVIDAVPQIEAELLETKMRELCDGLEMKTRELFMAIRLAVTGRKATPPLFETMAVLGKERCRRRLRAAITALKTRQ